MSLLNTSSLDTNIILRVITKDVPELCERAENLLNQKLNIFVVEDVAVMEAVHSLETSYHHTRADIVLELQSFFASKNISYSADVFEAVYPLYLKHPKLSFNDIYLSVKSELRSAEPLWTFDKKLATQLASPKFLSA